MFVLTWQLRRHQKQEEQWESCPVGILVKPHTAVGCNVETGLIKQLVAKLIQEMIHSKDYTYIYKLFLDGF